jgi:hypothetical protein
VQCLSMFTVMRRLSRRIRKSGRTPGRLARESFVQSRERLAALNNLESGFKLCLASGARPEASRDRSRLRAGRISWRKGANDRR